MTPGKQYRALASGMKNRALSEPSEELKSEWNNLAECYLRLAEQADKSGRADLSHDPLLFSGDSQIPLSRPRSG